MNVNNNKNTHMDNIEFKVNYFVNMLETIDWNSLDIKNTSKKEKSIIKMCDKVKEPLEKYFENGVDNKWNEEYWKLLEKMFHAMNKFQLKQKLNNYSKMWDTNPKTIVWHSSIDKNKTEVYIVANYSSKQKFLDQVETNFWERRDNLNEIKTKIKQRFLKKN